MSLAKALRLFLVLFVLASFACSSSRQTNQHKLLIYTPHGQDVLCDFVACYKQVHPEVDVQFGSYFPNKATNGCAIGTSRFVGAESRPFIGDVSGEFVDHLVPE